MKVGTKSVLFGAHCFFLHPFFVAIGWWRLYGFPWDPRLWVAFVVHDLGYLGCPNMDGPEGERHPWIPARVMTALFDWGRNGRSVRWDGVQRGTGRPYYLGRWGDLVLLHSRFLSKRMGTQPSRLCWADKLAIALTPSWLYVPLARATGEIFEYMKDYEWANPDAGTFDDMYAWHANVRAYCRKIAYEHRDGRPDRVTRARRHSPKGDGVWE